MSVAYAVRSHCRKLVKLGSIFRRDFNSSKCKTWAKMTTARIKLLRNKRETIVRQMRRDVALLLQSGQASTARIRVEHVIREQNMMAANEILELFCERIVTRLSIIAKQRECPADLKEAISSLIFAGPRCSDIPELQAIRDIFQKKYGKDFVSAATDLRPNCGVNRLLIEKLSALNPPGELKLKVMKEIAKEYQVEWDTTETEMELLKPPEERIEGPRTFVSAASLPVKPGTTPSTETHKPATARLSGGGEINGMNFQDATSAAKAAADSAENAIAAAQAAAQLAQTGSHGSNFNASNFNRANERNYRSQSLGATNYRRDSTETSKDDVDYVDFNRRHSSNVRAYTDIKFDDSDCDEEKEIEYDPFDQATPNVGKPGKLPDYDALAARFEELKYRKT